MFEYFIKPAVQSAFLLRFVLILLGISFELSLQAQESWTLPQVMQLAESSSDSFKSIDQSVKSLEAEIKSRDLELSAVLVSEIAGVREERDRLNNNDDSGVFSRGQRGDYGIYENTFIKPFETGTELQLGLNHNLWAGNSDLREKNFADWEMRISQSLWRNSFGQAVDLRRQAENFELKSRHLSALLEAQSFRQQIEDAFWDLVLAKKQVQISQSNVERSLKLQQWIKDRVEKFAAEDVDQLQVETLLSERQLDLDIAEDSRLNAANRLKQLIPDTEPASWNLNLKTLEQERDPLSLLAAADPDMSLNQPVLIDTLSINSRARQLEIEAKRIEDSISPDLSAYVSYGADGYDHEFGRSWEESADTDSNAARVGLIYTVELDYELRQEKLTSAKLAADSETSRLKASMLQSSVAWLELMRSIGSLKQQILEAIRLAALQNKKVAAEKERFEQGRSTTFQMVSFEVDASESELRLYRLMAGLRKAENRARAFILEQN
jgi:outer membrane protein TolC